MVPMKQMRRLYQSFNDGGNEVNQEIISVITDGANDVNQKVISVI